MNIYEQISEWLIDCPEIGNYVYFNVIPYEPDTSAVTSSGTSLILNTFINGAKEVRVIFNIELIKQYDDGGTSDINLDAMKAYENIISFVENKNNNQDYPNLGEGYVVNAIGSTYKAPEVYITSDNQNLARYEGQFFIEYLEERR